MTQDMQDNLEKFVKEHRDEFDDLSPNESVWKGIDKEMSSDTKRPSKMYLWQAAAVVLLALSVGLIMYINKDAIVPTQNVVAYDNEFIKTENYYASVINTKQQLIKIEAHTYPEIESDFENDWKMLDESYKSLKHEYEKNKSEELRSALVQNLRARLSLLNRQIEVLDQIKIASNNTFNI